MVESGYADDAVDKCLLSLREPGHITDDLELVVAFARVNKKRITEFFLNLFNFIYFFTRGGWPCDLREMMLPS